MRNFRYGMKALHQIEKTLDIRVMRLDINDLSLYQLAVLLWAGLSHEDATLTPESVMDLVDDHSNISEITEIMGKAFTSAFGSGGEEGKN